MDSFAAPLTELFKRALIKASDAVNNAAEIKIVYQCLGLIAKLFYSLNYQDLPEFFEENIKVWMEGFHVLLTAPNIPHLESDSDDQAGPQEILKGKNLCDKLLQNYKLKIFAQN